MRTEKKLASTTGMVGPGGATGSLPLVIAKSAVAVSGSADTNENTLATITIPANALGPNGWIRIYHNWSYTNSANNKSLRVRFSGGAGTLYTLIVATTTATCRHMIWIANRNATNSQHGGTSIVGVFGADTNSYQTSAVDTTAATTVVITGQKASAGETLTLESYYAELVYGA